MQGTCAFGAGCRGARLLVWLILNDRVQPSFVAGVVTAGVQACQPLTQRLCTVCGCAGDYAHVRWPGHGRVYVAQVRSHTHARTHAHNHPNQSCGKTLRHPEFQN